VALAAQGFLDPPHRVPTLRSLDRAVRRTGVLQVDSVNVLTRAHYMPLYSRLGAYDPELLARAQRRPRRLVEYWAHVQALMPVDLWPVMQHRMADYRAGRGKWGMAAADGLPERLAAEIRACGPATARDLDDGSPRSREHWGWNWSAARQALDYAFMSGLLAVAGRNASFEVVYDVPERVLPPDVLDAPVPDRDEAERELVRRAARSHGVATGRCLADYYRMRFQPGAGTRGARGAIEDLVEDGELVPVTIEGWRRPAYLHRDARLPRRVDARTLLSPFDPVVWLRERTEALFDFHYRIEIYVPRPQRRYGYYVLPFLLGERLVARVDLKADRAAGVLLVPGAHAEAAAPPETAQELAAELHRMAGWLGLDGVRVTGTGSLDASLRALTR
jgi:uncharacterized protein YcaQ